MKTLTLMSSILALSVSFFSFNAFASVGGTATVHFSGTMAHAVPTKQHVHIDSDQHVHYLEGNKTVVKKLDTNNNAEDVGFRFANGTHESVRILANSL